jgi:hypothetical protein
MLKKLAQRLQTLTKDQDTFDPSQFNDPLAMQIEWTPAKKSGVSFQTRKLVKINPYRIEFRISGFAIFFYSFFVLAGMSLLIGYSISKYQLNQLSFDTDTVIPLAIGLLFAIAGSCLLYFGTAPIVFDKMKSAFWKGRKEPEKGFDRKPLKHFVRFSDIHAFQIISEFCSGKSSYYSYELNIVRKDGTRVNVVDHGSKTKLKQDAQSLSMFLNRPLWDAIPMK